MGQLRNGFRLGALAAAGVLVLFILLTAALVGGRVAKEPAVATPTDVSHSAEEVAYAHARTLAEPPVVAGVTPQPSQPTATAVEARPTVAVRGGEREEEVPPSPSPAAQATPSAQPGKTDAVSTPAAPAPTPSNGASSTGEAIADLAAKFIGFNYVWGGQSPQPGFDCSGFTWYVYTRLGLKLPLHDLPGQYKAGPTVKKADLLPGDLVFFRNTYKAGISHVGIYVGDGRFIHAATPSAGVILSRLDERYYVSHYYGANRPWQ